MVEQVVRVGSVVDRVVARGLDEKGLLPGSELPGELSGENATGAVADLVGKNNGRWEVAAAGRSSLASAAMDGQSVSCGLLGLKLGGRSVRPVSMMWCPCECSFQLWCERPAERPHLAAPGELGKVLADVEAGGLCADRHKLAPYFAAERPASCRTTRVGRAPRRGRCR